MGNGLRIGRFSVPPIRLYPALIDAVKTVYEKHGVQEIDDLDMMAKTLGHASVRSGTFLLKLAALRAYGLLEGRGAVKVSDTGRKIADPTSKEEEAEALRRAISNIPLWRELYQRFGTELPPEFAKQLATIADCPREEAAEKADWVTKSYLTDTKPIRTFRRPTAGRENPLTKETPSEYPQIIEIKLGAIHISLPASKRDIETARSLLNLLENKLEDSRKED